MDGTPPEAKLLQLQHLDKAMKSFISSCKASDANVRLSAKVLLGLYQAAGHHLKQAPLVRAA